ncbi:hypothetical protein BC343_19615 [Mucilaginibacter pedocola]|uniref:Uncharacterized protein n=1 Tax=Mucilaginibacter pedocola TaxID=1792845 RepID=A0A1S9P6Q5_9SPHI|nr:hypothetical protein BC343_19615 [Mucilaginibacter pedocola]
MFDKYDWNAGNINFQSNQWIYRTHNLTLIPVAYISGNPSLNDFCPFKRPAAALQNLPSYIYSFTDQLGQRRSSSVAALTLLSNGTYAAMADVISAVAGCR